MDRERFEQIVAEEIRAIPEKFLQKLDNVTIVIEDEPTSVQKKKLMIRQGWTLFGLYEGVPQLVRGANYTAVLPDKITIFQKSIEAVAHNEEEVKEIVKNTVWYEIAHHFGMNEVEVHKAQNKKQKFSRGNL